ncbi:beta-1 adrenergic receptor-like [Nerophis ophidion]|uniref:beta-1 adrenergic receptor-like n=1 Tax=Nerophis ophidion TaxID=159077 RepID=UPI002AE06AD5|nr:beta-1 adrenergic receptor-like [Nerophis ophidion]
MTTLPLNTSATCAELESGQTSTPPCTLCCGGLVNRTLAVGFMVSLAFAIVVGNMVTLTVFLQTRQSRTPQGYLKVSLAVADMMVGVFVVPFSIYTEVSLMVANSPPSWYKRGSTSLGEWLRSWQPCMLIGPMFALCTFVSITTIFLMTVERSVAILWPLRKDTLVTRRRTLLLVVLSWTSSVLLALAPLILSSSFTLEYDECSRMCIYTPLNPQLSANSHVLLLFPAFDFTLLSGTLAVNIVSFTSIRRYTKRRELLSETSPNGGGCCKRPTLSDIKVAKTICILTLTFTASFTPIAVFVLGNVVGYTWCNFSFIAFWILACNSCCNVIIYSVRDQRFRKGVTLLFQREHSPPKGEKI